MLYSKEKMLYSKNYKVFIMNNTEFYKSFSFKLIELKNPKHTDNSKGITCNFVARMRSGSGYIVSADKKRIDLKKGDVFFLPIGLKYHSYWTPDPETKDVSWDSFAFECIPLKANARARALVIASDKELDKLFDKIANNPFVNCQTVSCLYSIIDIISKTQKEMFLSKPDQTLESIERFLTRNKPFSVKALAKECQMSQSALYLWFKKNLNMTPIDYKNKHKVNIAVNLLSYTDMDLEEITTITGFNSVSHLRNLIKQFYNKTPTQLRKESKLI